MIDDASEIRTLREALAKPRKPSRTWRLARSRSHQQQDARRAEPDPAGLPGRNGELGDRPRPDRVASG